MRLVSASLLEGPEIGLRWRRGRLGLDEWLSGLLERFRLGTELGAAGRQLLAGSEGGQIARIGCRLASGRSQATGNCQTAALAARISGVTPE